MLNMHSLLNLCINEETDMCHLISCCTIRFFRISLSCLIIINVYTLFTFNKDGRQRFHLGKYCFVFNVFTSVCRSKYRIFGCKLILYFFLVAILYKIMNFRSLYLEVCKLAFMHVLCVFPVK